MKSKDSQSQINVSEKDKSSRSLTYFIQEWILLNAKSNSPDDWRSSLKLVVAAILALSLWLLLGKIVLFHLESSREFANKIANLPDQDAERVAQIEKAALGFENTVKTFYALITPLATAITGYFLAASGSIENKNKVTDQEIKSLESQETKVTETNS